jgi:hypothetical protein
VEHPFETDAAGMIVTRPILGWATCPVQGMAVILLLRYSENPQDIDSGGRSLQTVLTPQQCLDLSNELTTQARRILAAPRSQEH